MNVGFAAGMNVGIAQSRGDYVITFDNDRIVKDPGWLKRLVITAESDERIGVVVPMLLFYGTNKIQSVGQVSPDFITRVTTCTRLSGNGLDDTGQFDSPLDIAAGNGLFRRSALDEVGLFDEKMFCYFEETDLCFRLARAGYKILGEPRSKTWHKGSSTTKVMSYFTIYHTYKNKIRFIIKNYALLDRTVALAFNSVYYAFLIVKFALGMRPDLSVAMAEAVWWNLKNWKDYIWQP
jgi:GT2 family glycosyltransferase